MLACTFRCRCRSGPYFLISHVSFSEMMHPGTKLWYLNVVQVGQTPVHSCCVTAFYTPSFEMIQVNSRHENELPQAASPPHPSTHPPFPACFFGAPHHLRLTCFVWTVLKNVVSVSARLNTHIFSSDASKATSFLSQRLMESGGGRDVRIEV